MSDPGSFTTQTPNETWLLALQGEERARDHALSDLSQILIRGLEAVLRPRVDHQAEAMAQDVAQEAMMRILDRLDTFRGESRFTTWAQKVAVRMALTKLRRKRWNNVQLSDLSDGKNVLRDLMQDHHRSPDEEAGMKMAMDAVLQSIENDLTDRQRRAMQAVVLEGMPLEEVAKRMGSTRNALYKLMHDARHRLKRTLKQRGINPADILDTMDG